MQITPSLFSYLLNSQIHWQLSYQYPQLSLVQGSVQETLGLDQQLNVEVTYGLLWANVQVLTANQAYLFKGVNKQKATEFKGVIQQDIKYFKLAKQSDALKAQLRPFLAQAHQFFSQDVYLSNGLIQEWKQGITQEIHALLNSMETVIARTPALGFEDPFQQYFDQVKQVLSTPLVAIPFIAVKNNQFVAAQTKQFKTFFDQVENQPLTTEQRHASVIFEDRNLLIAAAGSGKTSTIVGKVGYALLKGLYQPDQILVLAYNKNAAKELQERLQDKLKAFIPDELNLEVGTFHGLGMRIIAQATQKNQRLVMSPVA